MDAITKTIGVIVLSLIIVAIPILCGLSFALGWVDVIKWLLTLGTFVIWGAIALKIATDTT